MADWTDQNRSLWEKFVAKIGRVAHSAFMFESEGDSKGPKVKPELGVYVVTR